MTGGSYPPAEAGVPGDPFRYGQTMNGYGPPGVVSSDVPGFVSSHPMRPYFREDVPATYGMPATDNASMMVHGKQGMGFETAVASGQALNPYMGMHEFPSRQEVHTVPTAGASIALPSEASATLYVEGMPADCKRREAAHIFRPFIGFKEVRLVHKDAKRPGGEQLVLCFVDFADALCAATALEALQGYKLDENDYASPSLKLQFARIPGPRGAYRDNPGARHDGFQRRFVPRNNME